MELDTTFLASADVPADTPAAPAESATENTQAEVTQVATPAVEGQAAEAPASEQPAAAPAAAEVPAGAEDPGLDEAELERLAEDPKAPKWFRDQLKRVSGYTAKLKAESSTYQTELESLRTQYSQYEGKQPLAAEDLERLRAAEERQYKLSSYTATPEEVLASMRETVAPQKFSEIKNHLAWEFLETPDGQPDLENLQVIIDRFSGFKEGDTRVAAKDVLNAINALKRGTVSPTDLHEFSTDAEYEAYQKAKELESEVEQQRQLARDNAAFQERQARQMVLQNVVGQVQAQFQPQVESLLDKFGLNPVENEPKVATEFKQSVRNMIASKISEESAKNPSLSDVFKTLQLLSEPKGVRADQIQSEINNFVSSFPYKTALSKGLSELMQTVEKTVTAEAYRYKLLMSGYEQEVMKGQNAREIIGQPKQTEVLTDYTPEQLASMSAAERRHAVLTNVSNQLREVGKVNRFGG